jgi:predicted metal-dependent hydrolase
MPRVQLQLIFDPFRTGLTRRHFLHIGPRQVPILLVRNRRARRYLLRVLADASVRITIPRAGSLAEAQVFAERNLSWIEGQLQGLAKQSCVSREWLIGTELLVRGKTVKIEQMTRTEDRLIRFGDEIIKVSNPRADLRTEIENHLWKLAGKEFPPRVVTHAAMHQLNVHRVSVRNQKSRWGSCSRRGAISLNWRLIQAPTFVCDYVILHELMHLREMNHSTKFWREVRRVCPEYQTAERWLKQSSSLLR